LGQEIDIAEVQAQAEGVLRFRFVDPDTNLPGGSFYKVEVSP
jgi:ferredoxin-NADP reductase